MPNRGDGYREDMGEPRGVSPFDGSPTISSEDINPLYNRLDSVGVGRGRVLPELEKRIEDAIAGDPGIYPQGFHMEDGKISEFASEEKMIASQSPVTHDNFLNHPFHDFLKWKATNNDEAKKSI